MDKAINGPIKKVIKSGRIFEEYPLKNPTIDPNMLKKSTMAKNESIFLEVFAIPFFCVIPSRKAIIPKVVINAWSIKTKVSSPPNLTTLLLILTKLTTLPYRLKNKKHCMKILNLKI